MNSNLLLLASEISSDSIIEVIGREILGESEAAVAILDVQL